MELNLVDYFIVCIILIIPIISGIIIYKLYNIFQGIITFIILIYLICFISMELLGNKNFLNDSQLQLLINVTSIPYYLIFKGILSLPKINLYIVKNEKYIILTIVILIYILSQLISITIKRLRN